MSRSWKDLIPEKIGSSKRWLENHPKKVIATIIDVDLLPGFNTKTKQLALKVDIDEFWFRLSRGHCIILESAFGENIDNWRGKQISIERDDNPEIEEQFRGFIFSPIARNGKRNVKSAKKRKV